PGLRPPPLADLRERRDVLFFGLGDRERAAAAEREDLIFAASGRDLLPCRHAPRGKPSSRTLMSPTPLPTLYAERRARSRAAERAPARRPPRLSIARFAAA